LGPERRGGARHARHKRGDLLVESGDDALGRPAERVGFGARRKGGIPHDRCRIEADVEELRRYRKAGRFVLGKAGNWIGERLPGA